ncbi:uncharacterized protein BO96DRAFT_413393 [Aspergillus niger CBS 101883]|uniref:Uncharacterized protein n=1 Tax=Aspergillus niger ATCC 13496 TaxID=1353008 RepID=A0A370BVK8_ASPNG|nr:uncharacterized protein BO96DRAFT_413393 [Aspergillus niger CBS 101883]PYH55109.1 hypothetical protein BO96DRAFT_413393 [Aspergillus niger CBS 101883]RDH19533.1 hypothetical protein M747DRAFT_296382 [Aspergillus niger ATCC 13496]
MAIFCSGRVLTGSVRKTIWLGTLDIGVLLIDTDYTQEAFHHTMHGMRILPFKVKW